MTPPSKRRLRLTPIRVLSPIAGVAILYHEVWIATSSELVLVLVALWLIGAPIAQFLDILNRAGQFAEEIEGYHAQAEGLKDEIADEIDKATGGK